MINIRTDIDNKNNVNIKISFHKDLLDNRILKRCLFEGNKIKDKRYTYKLPGKFLLTLVNNLENVNLHKGNIESFLEFSDEYDEKYFYAKTADSKYMKKWREVGCPKIYKITIDREKNLILKEVIFTIKNPEV